MKYICNSCGYIYNDEIEKIKLIHLDETWICPICLMPKDIFTHYEDIDEYF